MKKAKSVREVLAVNHPVFPFEGKWQEAFSRPERRGVWFVWGESGNGKTSFIMKLCKKLAEYERVVYNSFEEGTGLTIQDTLKRFGMGDVNRRFLLLDKEPMDELGERLSKRRSPGIAVIDSFQYTQMTYKQYIAFKELHAGKLLIFISHADGKHPEGRTAKKVKYDASLKIYVEGYRAFSKGRFIGSSGFYDIWPEEAAKYWGEQNNMTK